jgi:hypothetical protein
VCESACLKIMVQVTTVGDEGAAASYDTAGHDRDAVGEG